jgi:hypothetical protein
MNRCVIAALSLLVLALMAVPAAFAGELCQAPPQASLLDGYTLASFLSSTILPASACSAWVATSYYSTAAHTTLVGRCTITCHQFDTGDAEPNFTEGGTCTGASSSFPVQFFTSCPCPP